MKDGQIPILVVLFLGITSIVLSLGILVLVFFDKKVDAALFALAGSGSGAMGSMLSNFSRAGQRATDAGNVTVTTPPDEPLSVREAPGGGEPNPEVESDTSKQ